MNSHDSPALDRAEKFLMSVHDTVPGVTEKVLERGRTANGLSSYRILADAANLHEGMRVADLACGSGVLTQLIAQRIGSSGQVVGIDLNHAELALAETRCKTSGNIRFLEESATRVSLPDAAADAVLCHMALMLFQPFDRAVAEIARILRPGGILAAVVPGVDHDNAAFSAIRKTLAAIVSRDVAPEKLVAVGCPEFGSVSGVRNLFSRNGNFDDDLQFTNFEVIFQETPETLATWLIPFFYSAYLLSGEGRKKLQESWAELFRKIPAAQPGKAAFHLPLTAFTVHRKQG